MTDELIILKNHFETNCNVTIVDTYENKLYPHWKYLKFNSLNSKELQSISIYIKTYFSKKGEFNHLLPKIGVINSSLALIIDIKQIKQFLL